MSMDEIRRVVFDIDVAFKQYREYNIAVKFCNAKDRVLSEVHFEFDKVFDKNKIDSILRIVNSPSPSHNLTPFDHYLFDFVKSDCIFLCEL